MINVEQLRFPTGIAAATTLRSLHSRGAEAERKARALYLSGALGALLTWMREANATWLKVTTGWQGFGWVKVEGPAWLSWIHYPRIPAQWTPGTISIGKYNVKDLSLAFEGSLLFVAAGAIIGMRQAWSLLLGTVVNYGILAPIFLDQGVIAGTGFRRISSWSLWIGVPMMVTSGLLMFFMQWRTVVRAFSTIAALFRPRGHVADDPMERIE